MLSREKALEKIKERLSELIQERKELLEECEKEKEFGTNRENIDECLGRLDGEIKALQWTLKLTKLTR